MLHSRNRCHCSPTSCKKHTTPFRLILYCMLTLHTSKLDAWLPKARLFTLDTWHRHTTHPDWVPGTTSQVAKPRHLLEYQFLFAGNSSRHVIKPFPCLHLHSCIISISCRTSLMPMDCIIPVRLMELPFFSAVMPCTYNVQLIHVQIDSTTVCVCLADQFVFNSYALPFFF